MKKLLFLYFLSISCIFSQPQNTLRQKNFGVRDTVYFDDIVGGKVVPSGEFIAHDSVYNRIIIGGLSVAGLTYTPTSYGYSQTDSSGSVRRAIVVDVDSDGEITNELSLAGSVVGAGGVVDLTLTGIKTIGTVSLAKSDITILWGAFTYTISADDSITLSGDRISFVGAGKWRTIFSATSGAGTASPLRFSQSDSVSLSDFSIVGNFSIGQTSARATPIRFDTSKFISIKDIAIKNGGSHDIIFRRCSNVRVEDSHLLSSYYSGIYFLNGGSNIVIDGNTIDSTCQYTLPAPTTAPSGHGAINYYADTSYTNYLARHDSSVYITNNIINDAFNNGIRFIVQDDQMDVRGVYVNFNKLYRCGGNYTRTRDGEPITISDGDPFQVIGNIIDKGNSSSILINGGAQNGIIANNSIWNGSQRYYTNGLRHAGIWLLSNLDGVNSDTTFANIIISNNQGGNDSTNIDPVSDTVAQTQGTLVTLARKASQVTRGNWRGITISGNVSQNTLSPVPVWWNPIQIRDSVLTFGNQKLGGGTKYFQVFNPISQQTGGGGLSETMRIHVVAEDEHPRLAGWRATTPEDTSTSDGSSIPRPVTDNTPLLSIEGYGYNGETYHMAARITINAEEDFDSSTVDDSYSGRIVFRTVREGQKVDSARWSILNNGKFLPASDGVYDIGSSSNHVKIVYTDSTLNTPKAIYNTTFGENSWTGVLTNDTATVVGGTVDDVYIVTLRGTSAPSANDVFAVESIDGGFIVRRSASGATGQAYSWWRLKRN